MIELQLINSIAPFVLCNKLLPMMKRDNTGQKHIVNVSAMEGKFHRFKKAARHPHTNMAKAALNMLTHTSAAELAEAGIFMNAVDTGWVTDEDPAHLSKSNRMCTTFSRRWILSTVQPGSAILFLTASIRVNTGAVNS
jgi:NAD(P)-dependent dehydrogenase (short-subunit alcohol dehydrogenase family)